MPHRITLESLTTEQPAYALNSILYRLALALGMKPDEHGGVQINVDDLIADVEDSLWRLTELQK